MMLALLNIKMISVLLTLLKTQQRCPCDDLMQWTHTYPPMNQLLQYG